MAGRCALNRMCPAFFAGRTITAPFSPSPYGKIFPDLTKELLECDTIIPGKRLRLPERAPSTLERRLKSVYNTQEELDEIFKDYSGTLVYL